VKSVIGNLVEFEDGPAAVTGDRFHNKATGVYLGRHEKWMNRKSENLPEMLDMVLPWKRGPVDTRKTGNPRINKFDSGFFYLRIMVTI